MARMLVPRRVVRVTVRRSTNFYPSMKVEA